MNVSDFMLSSVPTVTADASLREVATLLSERGGTAVLVVDDGGRPIGIVSEAVLSGVLSKIVEEQRRFPGENAIVLRKSVHASVGGPEVARAAS